MSTVTTDTTRDQPAVEGPKADHPVQKSEEDCGNEEINSHSPQANTEQLTEGGIMVTKQQSEGAPKVINSPRRQASDPQVLPSELNKIRETLCGSQQSPRKRPFSSYHRRHASLFAALKSYDGSHDHPSAPQPQLEITESLPPSKLRTTRYL